MISLLKKLLVWVTEASFIRGIAIGIVLSVLVAMTIQLDAIWFITKGFILVALAFLVGVIIGQFLVEKNKVKWYP